MLIVWNLFVIALMSVIIMFACDTFEHGSRKLGENLSEGIRGATINAIGSSLPELFTTTFLLFLYHDMDGFSGGIATCAGSAVFNSVVIPGLCIIVVLFFGVKTKNTIEKVDSIEVQRAVFLRDAFFFVASEIVLVLMLSGRIMSWWMGGLLLLLYVVYASYMVWQYRRHGIKMGAIGDDDDESDDEEFEETPGIFKALITLNFRWLFFRNKRLTRGRAWVLLLSGVFFIGIACHFLAAACVNVAKLLGVPLFFTTVVLAAAATSVPDTVLSVKDARHGEYDDAVSNAIGSNVFDITVGLGLPLLFYGLIFGDVKLRGEIGTEVASGAAGVQELRIVLLISTVFVVLIFLIGRKLGRVKAVLLFSIYILFLVYCIGRAYEWSWLKGIGHALHFSF